MSNEQLKEHLDVFVSYLNKLKNNEKYVPSKDELSILSSLSMEKSKDENLRVLMASLARKQSIDRQNRMVYEYIKSKENQRKINSQNLSVPKIKRLTNGINKYTGGYINIIIISIIIFLILLIITIYVLN